MSYKLSDAIIRSWPDPTPERPLRVLVSGCLAGRPCGAAASSYGDHPVTKALLRLPNVLATDFCPGDFAFGRPRRTANIEGGNGFDVVDGRVGVFSEDGRDWTEGIVFAAHRMVDLARHHGAHFVLLKDGSVACGLRAIPSGRRALRVYREGPGVAAALLARSGIPAVSERDDHILAALLRKLGWPDLVPLLSEGWPESGAQPFGYVR